MLGRRVRQSTYLPGRQTLPGEEGQAAYLSAGPPNPLPGEEGQAAFLRAGRPNCPTCPWRLPACRLNRAAILSALGRADSFPEWAGRPVEHSLWGTRVMWRFRSFSGEKRRAAHFVWLDGPPNCLFFCVCGGGGGRVFRFRPPTCLGWPHKICGLGIHLYQAQGKRLGHKNT